jgi:hypothetical protein
MRSYPKACVVLMILVPLMLEAEAGPSKISLEEVLSIGSLENDFLYQWVGVAVDAEGFIYVTDSMDYSLKKFDGAGMLLKTAGRRGQGPGEFTAPRLLDCRGEFLFVTEQYEPVIKVFDRDLNYKFNIPLKGPVMGIRAFDEELVAVAVFDALLKSQILFYDHKGKAVKTIAFSDGLSAVMMDMVSFDLDDEGGLYLAYTFRDKIEKYDRKGRKVWSGSLLGGKNVQRKKIGEYAVPTEITYKDIAVDSSGDIYLLGGHLSRNRSRDVYVLSREGRLRTTFTLPESSHCIYIDSRDFLYARANEGVTLKKYRIVKTAEE